MELTRWTHSCVTLEHAGRRLVLDPGCWSEPHALVGADAVLVTHQHGDHVDVLRVRGSGLPVWAPRDADLDLDVAGLQAGDRVDVAGFDVVAVGGRHAAVVPDQDVCANLGYLVSAGGRTVYHPGDALAVPEAEVDVLLVPMQASWLRTSEAVELVRAVAPGRAIGVHDGQVNDRGRLAIASWLASRGGAPFEWLEPGTTVDLG